jgi:tetratricopeptide (TPR) repeat protein
MGKARIAGGESMRGAEHFERALALARDELTRARLRPLAANSLVTTGDPRGLVYVREALAVLDPETHPVETASALSIEGRFHHLAGRHREAAALLERAAHLADPSRVEGALSSLHASILSLVYAYLSGAYQHLGLFEQADRWAWRAVEFGKTHRIVLAEAIGYEFLGENATATGEYERGLAYAAREREIVSPVHSRERLAWTGWVAAVCSMLTGDRDTAKREYEEALALAKRIGERRLHTLLSAFHGAFLADLGHLDEALRVALAALQQAEDLDLVYMRTESHRCLAHVRFRRGEIEEAIRHCEAVLALVEGKDPKVSRLWMGPLHVEALAAAGRREEARTRLDDYAALVAECQTPRFSREVVRLRAWLEPIRPS